MDRIESLGQQLSQITMYDLKTMYNQAKNVVLNISEMEAKVREATNEDPWGASSTLMQEIAQGTFNFQHFNEIMPSIYSRFMEKEARQWRQIYKALQLLEYIVKHGSERVVDDARSHISTIKMLRNFHYIDDKGKDQGLNVRQRSKELAELLSDLDRVRTERRQAKANRNKYIGTGNSGGYGDGNRYGGFGSDSYGGNDSYGYDNDNDYNGGRSGGAQGSGGSPSFRDETSRRGYEEYDAGDDETVRRSNSLPTRRSLAAGSSSAAAPNRGPPRNSRTAVMVPQATPPSSAIQEVDLLGGFGDDVPATAPTPAATLESAKASLDDDFDDFQSAPPAVSAPLQATVGFTPAPVGPKPASNVFDLLRQTKPGVISAIPTALPQYSAGTPAFSGAPVQPTAARPNYGHSSSNSFAVLSPSTSGTPAAAAPVSVTSPKSSSNFDDLWRISIGANASASKPSTSGPAGAGKSIKDLEREKAMAEMWGSTPSAPSAGTRAFGTTTTNNTGFGTDGGDDLLL